VSRTWKAIVGVLAGLAILGLWLYLVGFQETLAAMTTAAPGPALLAALAWLVALALRAWKWHRILVSVPTISVQAVPWKVSGRVYWASSFLNVLFPFRVGEVARSLFLKQLADVPIALSLPTVLVDRLYSIAIILGGLAFLPLSPFRMGTEGGGAISAISLRWGIGLVAGGFAATLIGLFVLRNQKERVLRWAGWFLRPLPDGARERLIRFMSATIDGMQYARGDARSLLGLLLLSLLTLGADALKDHFVLRTFGLQVPILHCFFGVCLTNLAFVLPSPPGNIGSNEWYATLVYSTGYGYNSAQVASGALFGHLLTTSAVAAAGALSLSSLGLTLAEGLRISQNALAAD
jgi:uncharacterized protein (TIRG00374 family)